MGAKPTTPLAANDKIFAQSVISGAMDPLVASSPFYPKQVVHCCKPFSHVKRCALALPFPSNHEFAKRISQQVWRQLNADLVDEMYEEAPPCLCARKGVNSLLLFNLQNHRALYKVIGHYNRHLFHPMLIDAQIFAYHAPQQVGSKAGNIRHHYFVGFLIANSPAEFMAFPRPEPGVSSGYQQLNLPEEYIYFGQCLAFPNFYLESPTMLPHAVPTTDPRPPSMHLHAEDYLRLEPQPIAGCDCYVWSVSQTSVGDASSATGIPGFATAQSAAPSIDRIERGGGAGISTQPAPVVVPVAPMAPSEPPLSDTITLSAPHTESNYGSSNYASTSSYNTSAASARVTPSSSAQQQMGSGRSGFFPFGQSTKREREW